MNNIVNIVNFIRAIEPRVGRGELDLFEPVREQMAMAKRLKLPTTWLLQYDALIQGPFVEFLKRVKSVMERRAGSGSYETRAHYAYLLSLVNDFMK